MPCSSTSTAACAKWGLAISLYGTVTPAAGDVEAMADYLRACAAILAAQPTAELIAGSVTFAALPGAAR